VTTTVRFAELASHDYKIAQVCASLGWPVLPWRYKDKEKIPTLSAWQLDATTDLDVVEQWWGYPGSSRYGNHVGIATGPAFGWVLDVDNKNGKDGDASLRRLLADHGETGLPRNWTVRTATGGWHHRFPWPTDGRKIKNSADGALGRGLDVRGFHGYVVAPLTKNDYGGRYTIEDDTWSDEPAPRWLEDLVERKAGDTCWVAGTYGDGLDYRTWVAEATHVREGQEEYLFRGLCSMRARNVDPAEMHRLGWEAASSFVNTRPDEPWTEQQVIDKVRYYVEKYPPGVSRDELAKLARNFYATVSGGTYS